MVPRAVREYLRLIHTKHQGLGVDSKRKMPSHFVGQQHVQKHPRDDSEWGFINKPQDCLDLLREQGASIDPRC
jgi:hypothetical protein